MTRATRVRQKTETFVFCRYRAARVVRETRRVFFQNVARSAPRRFIEYMYHIKPVSELSKTDLASSTFDVSIPERTPNCLPWFTTPRSR